MTTESRPEERTENKPADKAEAKSASSFAVVFPVICTLLGVGITSGLTWMTAYQTASISEKNACILKFDQQESEIRTKSANFLSAYGDIAAYLTVAKVLNPIDMQKSATPLFKSGFELMAYAPQDLSNTTFDLLLSLQDIILDEIHDRDLPEHQKLEIELYERWTSEYSQYLSSIQNKKSICD